MGRVLLWRGQGAWVTTGNALTLGREGGSATHGRDRRRGSGSPPTGRPRGARGRVGGAHLASLRRSAFLPIASRRPLPVVGGAEGRRAEADRAAPFSWG